MLGAVPARGISHHPAAARNVQAQAATSRAAFKQRILGSDPSFGLFLDAASPLVAEQIAWLGYDWVLVDQQHSPVSVTTLAHMLTAAGAAGCPALVRVAGPGDRAGIQQALDLGAAGVMIPTVNSASDARAAVDAAYFAPAGSRSVAWPVRPQLGREVSEYLSAANDEVAVLLQVETPGGYAALEEVLSVPGVTCAFVGPVDLSRSLGLAAKHGFPECLSCEEFKECSRRVVEVCRAKGVAAGNFAVGQGAAAEMVSQGFTVIATGTDLGLLEAAARANLESLAALRGPRGGEA